ncbi:murein L,D-transpeptidase [Ancylobacter sp. Lp-2]|uniref:L,D-transpeptidase family protein n=1 Tax=Ancylobacter sp. Lp-2 TaxID=2881339 RepID=UPI001E31F567|nr:murein L,D-transpeptidase family protein [Ancylobacter sp. Lp-2]MCB4770763.1 murein L,D-transpeptidase [Ancylobacter sp. Lp-2]
MLAGVAALALAGCTGDGGPSVNAKAMKALSPQTLALISEKGMTKDSPIVVRIFKEESELEVWKETTSGDYALLKTYPICRWSGELGPKVKEGDRQAPEGFYTITPGQMNPNSSYYLSFNLGFPNAYDRAWGRTGAHLMVHGDCSSAGCYAMTDEQIQEIFALGRESFQGGQRAFQVQAYPFHMTADNLARHRNNPNLAFWRMLKEGSDTFEVTRQLPKVDVCGRRYVFNATPADPNARFDPNAPCPEFTQPGGLGEAIAARKATDQQRIASASMPAAPVKTGKDGGMNQVFLAKLANPQAKAPGSLPAVVKPPGSDYGVDTNEPAPAESIALATAAQVPTAADVPLPLARPVDAPAAVAPQLAAAAGETSLFGRPAPAPTAQVASLDPAVVPAPAAPASGESSGGLLASVNRLLGRSEAPAEPVAPAAAPSSSPSGFAAIGNWLTGKSAEPAPAPAIPAAAPADVPVPPARPAAPRAAAPAAASQTHANRAVPQAAPSASVSTPAPLAAVAPAQGAASSGSPLPGASIMSTGTFSSSSAIQ